MTSITVGSHVHELKAAALVELFLGRHPSAAALRELSNRPPDVNLGYILTSEEFATIFESVASVQDLIRHDARDASIAEGIGWAELGLDLAFDEVKALKSVQTWTELIATLVCFSSVQSTVLGVIRDADRLQQFQDISRKLRGALLGPLDADLLRSRAPNVGSAATYANAPLATARAKSSGASGITAPTEKILPVSVPPQKAEPKAPTVYSTIVADSPELREAAAKSKIVASAASELLKLKNTELRKALTDLYRSEKFKDILLVFLCAQKGNRKPGLGILYLFAARVLLRLFLGESAYVVCKKLNEDPQLLSALSPGDNVRFKKTFSQAAYRSGRGDEGATILKRLVLEDPTDTESLFQYGEAIAGLDRASALEFFGAAAANEDKLTRPQLVSIAEYSLQSARFADAFQLIALLRKRFPDNYEYRLLLANAALYHREYDVWHHHIQEFFRHQNLVFPQHYSSFSAADAPLKLFGLMDMTTSPVKGPLVSIIMTSFNSVLTIESAINSVLRQSAQNLELFVVDDCSTDGTRDLLTDISRRDRRVKLLFNKNNSGTYSSKNSAIKQAKGEYITFHDSDDWMHPQRIETHLRKTVGKAASISHWVRMDKERICLLRKGGGIIHLNPASTFLSKQIFEKVGYFDSVRVGADSEFLSRIRSSFGEDQVVLVEEVLALGLHHENSLTQAGNTAFDEHRFSSVRSRYAEAWGEWQLIQNLNGTKMKIPYPIAKRPFQAPTEIVPGI